MVPISALTALPQTMTIEEAARVVAAKKYMRVPVYSDTVYNIVRYFALFRSSGNVIETTANAGDGFQRSHGGRLYADGCFLCSGNEKGRSAFDGHAEKTRTHGGGC